MGVEITSDEPQFNKWLHTPPNVSIFINDVPYLTAAALTGYVPYTGATGDVALGTHSLTAATATFTHAGMPLIVCDADNSVGGTISGVIDVKGKISGGVVQSALYFHPSNNGTGLIGQIIEMGWESGVTNANYGIQMNSSMPVIAYFVGIDANLSQENASGTTTMTFIQAKMSQHFSSTRTGDKQCMGLKLSMGCSGTHIISSSIGVSYANNIVSGVDYDTISGTGFPWSLNSDYQELRFGYVENAKIYTDGVDLWIDATTGITQFTTSIQPAGYNASDGSPGITTTITTAKLTITGANGSMVFKDGLLVSSTPAT